MKPIKQYKCPLVVIETFDTDLQCFFILIWWRGIVLANIFTYIVIEQPFLLRGVLR